MDKREQAKIDYEKSYNSLKAKNKVLHKNISNPRTKITQEIYHRVMGHSEGDE